MQNISSTTAPALTGDNNTITENEADLILSVEGQPVLPSLWIHGSKVFRKDGEVFKEVSLKESARLAAEAWAAVDAEEHSLSEGEAFVDWLELIAANLP